MGQGNWKMKVSGIWEKKGDISDSSSLEDDINKSTLPILTHKVFSHYCNDQIKEDYSNPEWQNLELFFWIFGERFERKSLPNHFRGYQKKYFIFRSIPENYNLWNAQAIPWFGMEGGANKYSVIHKKKHISIKDLQKENIIEYVKPIEITHENSWILKNKDNFSFIITGANVEYNPYKQEFTMDKVVKPLSELIDLGFIKLIKHCRKTA